MRFVWMVKIFFFVFLLGRGNLIFRLIFFGRIRVGLRVLILLVVIIICGFYKLKVIFNDNKYMYM